LIPFRNAAATVRRIIAIAISFFAKLPLKQKTHPAKLTRTLFQQPIRRSYKIRNQPAADYKTNDALNDLIMKIICVPILLIRMFWNIQ